MGSLAPTETLNIEHIGSTSVPGLGGKPYVDIALQRPLPASLKLSYDGWGGCGYMRSSPGGNWFIKDAQKPTKEVRASSSTSWTTIISGGAVSSGITCAPTTPTAVNTASSSVRSCAKLAREGLARCDIRSRSGPKWRRLCSKQATIMRCPHLHTHTHTHTHTHAHQQHQHFSRTSIQLFPLLSRHLRERMCMCTFSCECVDARLTHNTLTEQAEHRCRTRQRRTPAETEPRAGAGRPQLCAGKPEHRTGQGAARRIVQFGRGLDLLQDRIIRHKFNVGSACRRLREAIMLLLEFAPPSPVSGGFWHYYKCSYGAPQDTGFGLVMATVPTIVASTVPVPL